MISLGKRIKTRRHQLGLKAGWCAVRSGMSPAALSLLENEHSKGMDLASGLKLSRTLRMSPFALAFGDDSPELQQQTTVYTPLIGDTDHGAPAVWFERGCPVHGFADKVVTISIADAGKAYALTVSAAAGTLSKGDVVLLNPDAEAESGDDVLVCMGDDSAPKIMQMMFSKADAYHLKNYDDEQVITINHDQLTYIHPIVARVTMALVVDDPVTKNKELL